MGEVTPASIMTGSSNSEGIPPILMQPVEDQARQYLFLQYVFMMENFREFRKKKDLRFYFNAISYADVIITMLEPSMSKDPDFIYAKTMVEIADAKPQADTEEKKLKEYIERAIEIKKSITQVLYKVGFLKLESIKIPQDVEYAREILAVYGGIKDVI